MQRLVNAKRATRDLFNDSETLLRAADTLNEGYERELARPAAINFIGWRRSRSSRWSCCC